VANNSLCVTTMFNSGHVESPKRITSIFAKFKETGLLYRCKHLPVMLPSCHTDRNFLHESVITVIFIILFDLLC